MTSIVNQLNFKAAALKNQEDIFNKLTNEQKITLRVADIFKPEDASVAHTRLEAGGTRGRLVIEFHPEDL